MRKKPEVPLAEAFIQKRSRGLREPVVNRGKYHENNRANDYIMKMSNDKIRIRQLPVERGGGQHDACKAGNQELSHESDTEQHRGREAYLPAPHGANPVEDLIPVGTPTSMVEIAKKVLPIDVMPTANM